MSISLKERWEYCIGSDDLTEKYDRSQKMERLFGVIQVIRFQSGDERRP